VKALHQIWNTGVLALIDSRNPPLVRWQTADYASLQSALLRAAFRLALKLNIALLGDRGLLDGDHLPLHLRQLRRRLFIAADEERRWPEDDDRRRGGDTVLRALTILRT
jgi:hypothetical protein